MTRMNVLDDAKKLKVARVRLEHLDKFPDVCESAMTAGQTVTLPLRYFRKYGRVSFLAMGGSAIAADFIRDWMPNLPIDVYRGYDLPGHVTDSSLVFAMSYSGSTDETLSAVLQAYEKRCNIFSVSCDGKLREYASMLGFAHLDVPDSYDTQGAFPYLLIMPAIMLRQLGVASSSVNDREIREAAEICRKVRSECGPRVPERENPAKQTARALYGTIPAVYGPNDFSCVARRMKNYLNENAKVPARWDVFPELNHNEITGWDEPGRFTTRSSVILLRTATESRLMKERISASKGMLLKKKAKRLIELKSDGQSKLAQLLSLAYRGDFVTCYLAVLYGRNPSETRYQKKMKDRLSPAVLPGFDQKARGFAKAPVKPASSPELGKIS